MNKSFAPERRKLMAVGAAVVGGLIVPEAFAAEHRGKKEREAEGRVTPPEDLMREHGVLDRVLLVYEAGIAKFASNEDFDPLLFSSAAEIVRDFIENYHEKSEEEAVFPRFRKAGKMVGLVDTLQAQHQAAAALDRLAPDAGPANRSLALLYLSAIPRTLDRALLRDSATGARSAAEAR